MSIELNAIVLERIEVSPGLIILRVAPGGWELPEFDAGQFAVLGLPGAAPRCDLAMTEESKPDPSHQTGPARLLHLPLRRSMWSFTLWAAVLGTQIVATLFAVNGLFMTPLGWGWALFVWGYALVWFLVNDRVKLLAFVDSKLKRNFG